MSEPHWHPDAERARARGARMSLRSDVVDQRRSGADEKGKAMADLFNILKVTVGPKKLTARVLVNPGMPLMTSEDVEATARVYYLAPAIAEHMCLGDAGSKFQDCMGHTELAHLLEHLTVEIMNETGLAGGISSGRTRGVMGDDRLFDVEISCPDDVLAVGALSSASFMMNWAYLHADQTPPDFPGTVAALASLVGSLRGEAAAGDEAGAGSDGVADEHADACDEGGSYGMIDTEGASVVEHDETDGAVFGGAAAE